MGAPDLPIVASRDKIVRAVQRRQAVLIVGATGSGKSTQVVQFLLQAGLVSAQRGARCVITQPRRVAVTTVCRRVAAELGCDVGDTVGYAMRFEKMCGDTTAVKFVTDGYLIREAVGDPGLAEYRVVILDEAHERSLETDVACGLAKRALATRKDLTVVAMSATLDVAVLSEFFGGAKVIRVPGRMHKVDVYYCKEPQLDMVESAALATAQLHADPSCQGDILVFMPGQEEIAAVVALLESYKLGVVVLSLYAAMPAHEQLRVFEKAASRKIVVATTIAETSVTIPGVRHVVDPGLVKARRFSSESGFESLDVVPTSKSQAVQRLGRAGREAPGRCYRLYPEPEFAKLQDDTPPEIERADLASVVLQLKTLGVEKPQDFDYVSPPPRQALLRALELLYALDALDETGKLLPKGSAIARLPLAPLFANLVVLTREPRFAHARQGIVAIVALLAAADHGIFAPRRRFRDNDEDYRRGDDFQDRASDLLTELNAFRAFRRATRKHAKSDAADRHWCDLHSLSLSALRTAHRAASQILAVDDAERKRLSLTASATTTHDDRDVTLDCLLAGLSVVNGAIRDPRHKCFRTFRRNLHVHVHPASVLHARNPPPEAIVFASCVVTNKRYVRGVSACAAARLPSLVPNLFVAATTAI